MRQNCVLPYILSATVVLQGHASAQQLGNDALSTCIASQMGNVTGLTADDLDLTMQSLDEAAYRQRMEQRLSDPDAELVCLGPEERGRHDAVMNGSIIAYTPVERRERQLRQMRREGAFCALAADAMAETGLGSSALGVEADIGQVLARQQQVIDLVDGVEPTGDGVVGATSLFVGLISVGLTLYIWQEVNSAEQRRIEALGRQAADLSRLTDTLSGDLATIRDLQGRFPDGSFDDAYITLRIRNGEGPALSDEALEALEAADADFLVEAEDAVEAARDSAQEARDTARRAVEAAIEVQCNDDDSCRPAPEAFCDGDIACLERAVEESFRPAELLIAECIQQTGFSPMNDTPSPNAEPPPTQAFGNVQPGMPACWVEHRRSPCAEAGAPDDPQCTDQEMLQGGVLDSEIRMRILHTRCPDDDGLCHIAQDLALGVSSNAMIVDLLCGRPIALPPSMDAPSDQQAMESGLLEAVAACIAPPGTLAEDPDPSSAPETNRPVGSLATTLTVAVPEPFQPNPNATCLSTEEAARLYGDRFLLQSIQASPLCGTSADCAREILSATDRIRSRTERGAILTGQQQEADRIAASCIAQPELEWAVNRLRSQFFFGPRPWLGSPEISDEPSIGPPAFDYELPIIGELGPVLPELQVPQSPIDGLPGPMPVPAEILSPDLRAYTTFAASDGGIDAFRATFCSLDPPALPDVPMPQR